MPLINSYTNWGKLEEVFLGDIYPANWYDHLPSDVRDCFYLLTERTKEDLAVIERLLQSFGVTVRRPEYKHIDDHIIERTGHLEKPRITPRDHYLTVGNTLYATRPGVQYDPWSPHLDYYISQGEDVQPELLTPDKLLSINGASTVRAGKDIYIDLYGAVNRLNVPNESLLTWFKQHFQSKFSEYRVHVVFNGGHLDGCFALLKPGVMLTSSYFTDYDKTFPGWQRINIREPSFKNHLYGQRKKGSPLYNTNWFMDDSKFDNRAFNKHLIDHAMTWIGDYTETFFEVNCLVIDEKNVIIPGENPIVFEELHKLGITAHPVPFRTRTFWDGGMHCLTLDIRRQDSAVDLFPERGNTSLTVYD